MNPEMKGGFEMSDFKMPSMSGKGKKGGRSKRVAGGGKITKLEVDGPSEEGTYSVKILSNDAAVPADPAADPDADPDADHDAASAAASATPEGEVPEGGGKRRKRKTAAKKSKKSKKGSTRKARKGRK
jgi:hypothetical protein